MSDQIIPQATWQPRWYYVMVNKTSGKKYVGQTTQINMGMYCGSGGYWTNHCKKHGGWDRQNIDVLEQTWMADKVQAQEWLDAFAAENGEYWLRNNKDWANVCKETTEDSPFAGFTDDQRKVIAKAGGEIAGKKNVESGHLARICSAGGKIAGKKHAESGHMSRMGKIGGKITGKKHAESGHTSRMGKIQGKKNVESGHMSRIGKIGGKIVGKERGQNMKLMSQFCKIFNVKSPGKNYVNIDKAAFLAWKESLTQVSEIG
jgi:hypothetical protein